MVMIGMWATTGNGELSIKYDPPGTWDWSGQKFITLDVKVESTAEVGFRLYVGTQTAQYGWWEYKALPNGVWVKLVAQLDQWSGGGFDMASVDWVELCPLSAAVKPITAWVDNISVDVASEVGSGIYLRLSGEGLSPIMPDMPGEIAYFFTEQINEDEMTKIKTLRADDFNRPDLTFENINPTKYRVRVSADEPFFLVLSEFYHWGWKAYSGDVNWFEAFFEEPISVDEHFIANGYANAWHIDETGDYEITLYFWPQSLFYGGLVVALLTIVGCVSYLIISKIKHRKYHPEKSSQNE